MATDDDGGDDRDQGDREDEDDRDRRNTGKGGGRGGEMVTVQERRRWRGPTRRYAQAQRRPADRRQAESAFSTGPGEAVEYHYHRVPTYHHQYAAQMAEGMENNPT